MEYEITKLFSTLGIYIAGAVGIGILFLLLIVIRYGYSWVGKKLMSWIRKFITGGKGLNGKLRQSIKFINDLVAQLNYALDGDRCYVLEFHNGQDFVSGSPRWRLTQSYEFCADGIASQGFSLREVEVSMVWDMVQVYFSHQNDKLPDGISVYKPEEPYCTLKNRSCPAPKRVYLFDVEKMRNTYTKALLEHHGVFYMLHSPIVDEENNIVGVICVDYQEEGALNNIINNSEFNGCTLCRGADQVALSWINLDKKKK